MKFYTPNAQTKSDTPAKAGPGSGDESMLLKMMSAETAVLTHVHEFEGSTKLAEIVEEPHNHRTAGISGPEIDVPGGHVHCVFTRTDFFSNHYHFIDVTSGLQIDVGNGKHVHFVSGTTTEADDHVHDFQFALQIEDPLSPTPTDP